MLSRLALHTVVVGLIALSTWGMVDRAFFLYLLWRSASPDGGEEVLDLRSISALSAFLLNGIPLGLAIGLDQRAHWARTLTIILALCLLIPSALAELGILRDDTPMKPYNWLVVGICAVVFLILIHPNLNVLFQRQRKIDHSENRS